MTGALVIFVAMVIIGILLYVTDVAYFRHHHSSASSDNPPAQDTSSSEVENSLGIDQRKAELQEEVCCGMHLVCEKTSVAIVSDEIIYYDDEELDRFKGRSPESYDHAETEEFRDVLLTLLPQDVAGWARSITLRQIQLPSEVKEELLLLLSEIRSTAL